MGTKLISTLITIITFIGLIFGFYFWMENRYASTLYAQSVMQHSQQVEQRLDYKIKSDQAKGIQSRIWQLQDRCKTLCDLTSQEELRSSTGRP